MRSQRVFGAGHGAVLVAEIHQQIVVGVGALARQEKKYVFT